MKYVGMQTQIRRNNRLSVLLLLLFPVIILGMVWVFLALLNYFGNGYYNQYGELVHSLDVETVNYYFVTTIPWVILVYNIVENLCMTCGMDMPQINVVDDPQLNAFASGIDKGSYTVTVTTGLTELLTDEELSGVIGHELTHIRNRDTRLLITSIIFVGIISTVMSLTVRMMNNMILFGGGNSRRDGKGNGLSVIVIMLIGLICCAVAYVFTLLTRFAISRKREYMADAGGAELCGNPLALASALRKISDNPGLTDVNRDDVAQLFIVHPQGLTQGFMSFFSSLFSTHPDTAKRIEILEQF